MSKSSSYKFAVYLLKSLPNYLIMTQMGVYLSYILLSFIPNSLLLGCIAYNTNWKCCTINNKCKEGRGDCDIDSDCEAGLKCGYDNCINFPESHYDCCYKP